jgi:CRISPR-associated protein Cas2
MRRRAKDLSAYRSMWLFAMFDLPVDSKAARKRYARFRKVLLREGFTMLQFSVYARHCASEESSTVIRQTVRQSLPPTGQVRLVAITDRQFGQMEVFYGKKRSKTELPPPQLMLF